ncbi:MAG TPA: nucleotide exchange factor GrpE [Bryobacteraceae bacterium]
MTRRTAAVVLLGYASQFLLGQAQSHPPWDIVFVVDNSRSLRFTHAASPLSGALPAFAARLPLNSTVGLLVFAKNPNVVLERQSAAAAPFQSALRAALASLNYKNSRSDFAEALERAIYELREPTGRNGPGAVILVTSGVLNLGNASLSAQKTRWVRDGLAQEAARRQIPVFSILAGPSADFQLFQELSRVTAGEYYRASSPAQLTSALTAIAQRLTAVDRPDHPAPPIRLASERSPGILDRRSLAAAAVAAVLLFLTIALTRKYLRRSTAPERNAAHPVSEDPPPSLSTLREQAGTVSKTLCDAADSLARANDAVPQFRKALDSYALSTFKRLRDANECCLTLARECISLLDHLDITIDRAQAVNEPVQSLVGVRQRLLGLLEAARIEEIPVKPGDLFDGSVQVSVEAVAGPGPEGVVAEVSRKGYSMRIDGADVLIRAAEVVVSAKQAQLRSEGLA